VIVIGALVVLAALAAVVAIAWLLMRAKIHPQRRWVSGPNANWGQSPQPKADAALPALLTMMLYQMMQNQQQETEQLWMMSEPANDIPALPDSTWDFEP